MLTCSCNRVRCNSSTKEARQTWSRTCPHELFVLGNVVACNCCPTCAIACIARKTLLRHPAGLTCFSGCEGEVLRAGEKALGPPG